MLNNFKLYKPVIDVIIDIRTNGIDINVNNKCQIVYFDLFNFSGVNLELHSILVFHESFNSTYPCREWRKNIVKKMH